MFLTHSFRTRAIGQLNDKSYISQHLLRTLRTMPFKDVAVQKQPLQLFCKKGVLRNFAKFTRKRLCQSIFFNKVAGLRPATLLIKRLCHRRFPVSFMKFLRTPFLQNTSGRLLPAVLFNMSSECLLNKKGE